MGIILLIELTVLFILSILLRKSKYLNPSSVFYGIWIIIILFSNMNLYGLIKPSNNVFFALFLMFAFYFFGTMIGNIKIKTQNKKKEYNNFEFNTKLIYILSVFLIFFLLKDSVTVLSKLKSGIKMWKIRDAGMEAFDAENGGSIIIEAFRNAILSPFSSVLTACTAYITFNSPKNKYKKKFLFITLSILLLTAFSSGGGRLLFIYYVGCFIISFFVAYADKKVDLTILRKYKKNIKKIIICGFGAVILFTSLRTSTSFFKQAYTYFAIPPTLLNAWMPIIEKEPKTYGMLTFFGVHSYIFRFLDIIGFDFLVPNVYDTAYQYALNVAINKNIGYRLLNGFVTPIYYFYLDGGYFGICIFSTIFGFIVRKMFNKIKKNMNIKNFVKYALIIYGLFISFIRVQTCIPSYIICFIMVEFIVKTKKGSDLNE